MLYVIIGKVDRISPGERGRKNIHFSSRWLLPPTDESLSPAQRSPEPEMGNIHPFLAGPIALISGALNV
jgi:hypothetical protein